MVVRAMAPSAPSAVASVRLIRGPWEIARWLTRLRISSSSRHSITSAT